MGLRICLLLFLRVCAMWVRACMYACYFAALLWVVQVCVCLELLQGVFVSWLGCGV